MAGSRSVGLLLWREAASGIEVLLGHMGGPFWVRKDDHGWSVPKGLAEPDDEHDLAVAECEFAEELGASAPAAVVDDLDLGEVRSGQKRIRVFAREADFNVDTIDSNPFEMEWPPRSGQLQSFPEIDRAEWFAPDVARRKLTKAQGPFVDRLLELLAD